MKNGLSQMVFSGFLILFSFFIGYLFGKDITLESVSMKNEEKKYVNIIIKNKSLEFIKSSESIDVLINGEKSSTGIIILE